MAAVSASLIAPDAFEEESYRYPEIEDIEFDLRNLVACNPHAIEPAALSGLPNEKEEYLRKKAQMGAQQLIAKLFTLPSEMGAEGRVAILPEGETTLLPREKPLPTQRPETKWEKFAKEKGISKKKSDRKVWDEKRQEWLPNWGYKRANDGVLDEPLVELKEGAEMQNPWTKARAEKLARVQKNLKQKVKNNMRAKGMNPMAGIPVDMLSSTDTSKRKRGRDNTRKALELVQGSTASMGKFDRSRSGEPEQKKGPGSTIRRKFKSVVSANGPAEETNSAMRVLNSVLINREKKTNSAATAKQSKSNFVAYDAIEGTDSMTSSRKKKGRAAAGKAKKITKKRAK